VEKRIQQRIPRQLPCEIATADGQRTAGVVHDISERGLFVQTGANAGTNSVVEIIFPANQGRPEYRVQAGVARRRRVAPQLAASVGSGLGLEILPSQMDFKQWVRGSLGTEANFETLDDETVESDTEVRTFCFRLAHDESRETQTLSVESPTYSDARASVLAQAATGWQITNVQSR
jgi:hypothetical protein